MRLYLGCAEPPFHPQHLEVLGDPNEWTWVDYYVDHPHIKKWDASKLSEVQDGMATDIYSSHLIEHFSHREIEDIFKVWYRKLSTGGKMTLNCPDLEWGAKQIIRYANGQPIESEYFNSFAGDHGLLAIIYGTHSHDGEYHKCGFTQDYLYSLLKGIGFQEVMVEKQYDAHDMGILLTTAIK